MEACKIAGLEIARHNEGTGEGIAQGKRHGCAGSGRQTHGASLVLHGDIQMHGAVLRQK